VGVEGRSFFDEEKEVWRAENGSVCRIEGDLGAFALCETVCGDAVVEVDFFVGGGTTESASDEWTERFLDRLVEWGFREAD
jgi:hypothetical protein